MSEWDSDDIEGNLETIRNLADIGMLLIRFGKPQYIPTILEDIWEHSQRLALDYATVAPVMRKEAP